MKVLVVIPAYNEADSICRVVDDIIAHYPAYAYVVVNDGSKDDTKRLCREKGYNLIDLPVNIGLSGAVQTGMKYAYEQGYDAAVQFDGDGQHNARYIDGLLAAMTAQDADIVIGSRFLGGEARFNARMLGGRLIRTLITLFTGCRISDPTSGMRLFRRAIIKEFAYNMNYTPEPDTIAYLISNGAKVCEVRVEMNERETGVSYLNPTRAIRYMLHMCISIVFIQRFRKRRD